MPKTVEIGGNGGHVGIEVYNYERSGAADEDDANWLKAKCSVAVGEFSCVVGLSLVTHDFVQFLTQLEEAVRQLKGTAVFATLEEGLELEINFKSAGQADLFGRARSQTSLLPKQTVLSFSFETDQSFLAQTLRELKELVRQFAVRTGNSPHRKLGRRSSLPSK
jgi:hypothetical protein